MECPGDIAMVLDKASFTGEQYLKQQLDNLRKYIYNVGQRYPAEMREQKLEGIPSALNTMGNLVDEVVKKRGQECASLNRKYGGL